MRNDDLAGALEDQADAMEALREGMRSMGEAMARDNNPGGPDDGRGNPGRAQADPLGRESGQGRRAGTEDSLLQGEDVYRRARDLLDEIRRRSGEGARPEYRAGLPRAPARPVLSHFRTVASRSATVAVSVARPSSTACTYCVERGLGVGPQADNLRGHQVDDKRPDAGHHCQPEPGARTATYVARARLPTWRGQASRWCRGTRSERN
ncbi:MAG: DUF4175 family protein [Roseovarius sp.]|nr:DUF4175 family protein [Roseovarius sp.]